MVEGPPPPSIIVEKVKPLPLPGQLKKLDGKAKKTEELDDPLMRIDEVSPETGRADALSVRFTVDLLEAASMGEDKR